MISPPDLFRAAALRHRQLRRSPGYVGGPDALDHHVSTLMRGMAEGGDARVLFQADEVVAMVAFVPGELVPGSGPVTFVVAHQVAGHDAAPWLADQLDDMGLPEDPFVRLMPWDRNLRQVFLDRGLGLSSVSLAGHVPVALARLIKLPQSARDVGELVPGARLRSLTQADLDGVMALYTEVFEAEPQFCSFGALPSYHAALRRRHGEGASAPEPGVHFVLEVDGAVRGVVGGWIRPDLHTPPSGLGMDLLLGPELRGKGLSWVAYRRVLEAAFPRGAAWIKGTTGQPGVIKAARAMGRFTTGVELRNTGVFHEAWFHEALTDEAMGTIED